MPGDVDLSPYLDEEGRITHWPAKKKSAVRSGLREYLACKISTQFTLNELAINQLLNRWHTFGDHAFLRRELVDHGLIKRDQEGTAYWREEPEK